LTNDSAGRIATLIMPDRNGNPRAFETYTYGAAGRKTKITHVEDALPSGTCGPQGCGTFFGPDGTDAAYGAPGAATITSIYGMFRIHQLHRYDAHNHRIEKVVRLAHNVDRETFTYNDHGDMISQTSEETGRAAYDVGEDGRLMVKEETARSQRSEGRFRYQYDSHGNWTEKIGESPEGQIWSIERRTITYDEIACS
jgi:hypothetical protein